MEVKQAAVEKRIAEEKIEDILFNLEFSTGLRVTSIQHQEIRTADGEKTRNIITLISEVE